MERNGTSLLVVILIALVAIHFSCAPAYIPNVVSTPMLGDKGEFAGSLNIGISGFDPQVGYAVTEQIGIIANGSFRNTSSDSSANFHKHIFAEFGGGYFTKIGNVFRFEAYGGGGAGRINAEFDNKLFISYADVFSTRVFLQPSLGLVTDVVELAFSTRFVYVNLMQDGNRVASPFIEPALTAKLGYKPVKAMMQLGFSLPLYQELNFFYQPFIFSLGVQLRLNDLKF